MLYLLLAGCELLGGSSGSGGSWIDQTPSCDADPYDWSNDLITFLQTGSGDGSFDLDPDDAPRAAITGSYDADDGEFAYEIGYADGYFLTSGQVEDGFGTAWHNGDLDVQYVLRIEDKLEDKQAVAIRVERVGCDEARWAWDPDADEPVFSELEGTYSADMFEWSQKVDDASFTGSLAPDGTSIQRYEQDGNDYDETLTTRPDGTVEREFRIKQNSLVYEGEGLQNFDGTSISSYEISEDGEKLCEVETEYEYDGDGKEQWTCGDDEFECETDTKSDGSCIYECDDGQSGSC